MKFWRTLAVVTVALFAATAAFAAMAPKAPAAASPALSCLKNTEASPTFPMVMSTAFQDDTSSNVGNGFPWENSTFFFSTFRNQYLYPSNTVNNVRKTTFVMNGIHARNTSFTAANTNPYGSFGPFAGPVYANGPSQVIVTDAVTDSLAATFAVNPGPTEYCRLEGTDTDPFTIGTITGPNGSLLSSCITCPADPDCKAGSQSDCWCNMGDLGAISNILVDMALSVVPGGSGAGVWDMNGFGNTPDPGQRGYGSGSFINPAHLTTAYGIDDADFVWVFQGVAPPPPATVEQQIKEIVRLLLTPQGLRCSGLDMNPDNGLIEDDPITFPMGRFIDPIQPQITTGGTITGDETRDDLRAHGWRP